MAHVWTAEQRYTCNHQFDCMVCNQPIVQQYFPDDCLCCDCIDKGYDSTFVDGEPVVIEPTLTKEVMEPTDKFTYDVYDKFVDVSSGVWLVWYVDVKLRATGELVHRTIQYNFQGDAVEAALDWMDEHMDNEDM